MIELYIVIHFCQWRSCTGDRHRTRKLKKQKTLIFTDYADLQSTDIDYKKELNDYREERYGYTD